jgi:hypothetical protein
MSDIERARDAVTRGADGMVGAAKCLVAAGKGGLRRCSVIVGYEDGSGGCGEYSFCLPTAGAAALLNAHFCEETKIMALRRRKLAELEAGGGGA